MQQVVVVLFVLAEFSSARLAGAAVFALVAPGLIVSPLAGSVLDRGSRLRLIRLDYAHRIAWRCNHRRDERHHPESRAHPRDCDLLGPGQVMRPVPPPGEFYNGSPSLHRYSPAGP
jgi:hypothetical protein